MFIPVYEDGHIYCFKNEKGESKGPFVSAWPGYFGRYVVKKPDIAGCYFFDKETGKLSRRFANAMPYDEFGFAKVKCTKNGRWQFMDTEYNIHEDEFEEVDDYSEGLARVQLYRNGQYYFRDTQGNVSNDSYAYAGRYKEGFVNVSNKYCGGTCWYRDLNGNLSEELAAANPYRNGYGAVRLVNEKEMRLRDKNGNYSEDSYYSIDNSTSDPPGFVIVKKTENGPNQYRDYLGNVADEVTRKGREFFEYINERLDVFDLHVSCFSDDKFLNIIMQREQNMLLQASEHCQTAEDVKRVQELAEFTGDYIRDMAYEGELWAQEEAARLKELEKRTLETMREELKNGIQKMF